MIEKYKWFSLASGIKDDGKTFEGGLLLDERSYVSYPDAYEKDGFMMLIPAPQDLVTGEPNKSAIATIDIKKYD